MSDPAARRATAEAHLIAGDAQAAFAELRPAMSHPARLVASEQGDTLGLAARIFAALGASELAPRAAHCADALDDVDGLYDLGYHLIEAGLPAVAACVLARCHQLAPGSEPVVTELCAALERHLHYGAARDVLEGEPGLVASSFLCGYLYAYNAAMSGDLMVARRILPTLAPTEEVHALMRDRIAAIVARADQLAAVATLDDRDLRGWHMVLTGGVLLHRSPHGLDTPMHGRYAWFQDSYPRLRAGLAGLVDLLAAWGWQPPCVYAPPGRDHEAVAGAAATLLGVPLAPWPELGVPAPGLIVVYELGTLAPAVLERLSERRLEQLLYAHAVAWTEDCPVAPDVVTLVHQHLVAPWDARVTVAPDSREPARAAADERPAAALTAAILAADGDDDPPEERAAALSLARIGGRPGPGRREHFWAGGPVPSNRFM